MVTLLMEETGDPLLIRVGLVLLLYALITLMEETDDNTHGGDR